MNRSGNVREVGLAAVLAATELCEAVRAELVQGNGPASLSKQDRSPVTVADFGSQALICRRLRETFPADAIVAEEDSAQLCQGPHAAQLEAVVRFVETQVGRTTPAEVCRWIDFGGGQAAGRYWVLDPIDGTAGFLRNDQYAIALALIEDGRVQWGFLSCPALPHGAERGTVLVAERGAGASALSQAGAPLGRPRVSPVATLEQARLAESYESTHTNQGLSARLKTRLGIAAEPVRMDSQAKYAAVASGQAEIYLRSPNERSPEYREWVWDHAAGALVVEEAGGRVTDVYGRPLDWSHGRRLAETVGVLATNGVLHDQVLEALAGLLPPR
jgi:3'(2'), 5'-bisphosphate nucleotidase